MGSQALELPAGGDCSKKKIVFKKLSLAPYCLLIQEISYII